MQGGSAKAGAGSSAEETVLGPKIAELTELLAAVDVEAAPSVPSVPFPALRDGLLQQAGKLLHESARVGLVLKPGIDSESLSFISSSLTEAAAKLVSLSQLYLRYFGPSMRHAVQRAVALVVMSCLAQLGKVLEDVGGDASGVAAAVGPGTWKGASYGLVKDRVDALSKLPRSDSGCLLRGVFELARMLKDCQDELHEEAPNRPDAEAVLAVLKSRLSGEMPEECVPEEGEGQERKAPSAGEESDGFSDDLDEAGGELDALEALVVFAGGQSLKGLRAWLKQVLALIKAMECARKSTTQSFIAVVERVGRSSSDSEVDGMPVPPPELASWWSWAQSTQAAFSALRDALIDYTDAVSSGPDDIEGVSALLHAVRSAWEDCVAKFVAVSDTASASDQLPDVSEAQRSEFVQVCDRVRGSFDRLSDLLGCMLAGDIPRTRALLDSQVGQPSQGHALQGAAAQ